MNGRHVQCFSAAFLFSRHQLVPEGFGQHFCMSTNFYKMLKHTKHLTSCIVNVNFTIDYYPIMRLHDFKSSHLYSLEILVTLVNIAMM